MFLDHHSIAAGFPGLRDPCFDVGCSQRFLQESEIDEAVAVEAVVLRSRCCPLLFVYLGDEPQFNGSSKTRCHGPVIIQLK